VGLGPLGTAGGIEELGAATLGGRLAGGTGLKGDRQRETVWRREPTSTAWSNEPSEEAVRPRSGDATGVV